MEGKECDVVQSPVGTTDRVAARGRSAVGCLLRKHRAGSLRRTIGTSAKVKNNMNGEFNALSRGLLRHPKKKLPICKADRELDASAIHGRLGAQVALLQSPILPTVRKT